jgi:hypothetical protein
MNRRMTAEERQHWFRSFWDTTLDDYPPESPLREPAMRTALDDVAQFWTSCIKRFEASNELWPIKTKFFFLMWLIPEYAAKHGVDVDQLYEVAIRYSIHCEWRDEINDECMNRLRSGLDKRREERERFRC